MNKADRKKFDNVLLTILILMSAISLLMIYSSIPLLSGNLNSTDILIKQIVWWILGYGTLIFLFYLGPERIQSSIFVIYYILIAALLLLLLQKQLLLPFLRPFVYIRNGSASWFVLPGIGTIQPSEFMKIALVILVPELIERHHKEHPISSMSTDVLLVWKIMKYVIPPFLLTYLQPDSGLAFIMLIGIVSMLLVSGIRREWIIIGISTVGLLLIIVFIGYLISPEFIITYVIGGTYKLNRIYGWLNPEQHILGFGNQLYTALLAIGSAGITGYGLQSVPIYIAEAQNDFIFAIVGSTFGLIGSMSVLILSLSLDLRLLQIGMKSTSLKGKYLIAGLVGILAFQQIENMGMIVGLLPITGITLPFISAGGSSLLSYMIVLSLVMQIYSDIIKEQSRVS